LSLFAILFTPFQARLAHQMIGGYAYNYSIIIATLFVKYFFAIFQFFFSATEQTLNVPDTDCIDCFDIPIADAIFATST